MLKEELSSLKYKGEFQSNNFQMYVACHKKIFQQIQNLQNNCYAGIDPGTCMRYFLGGIDKPALKTAVQIWESQDSYNVSFQNCTSYLTTIVHWTLIAKQVNVAVDTTMIEGIKLKNRSGTD